jgi:hypothetical protein
MAKVILVWAARINNGFRVKKFSAPDKSESLV